MRVGLPRLGREEEALLGQGVLYFAQSSQSLGELSRHGRLQPYIAWFPNSVLLFTFCPPQQLYMQILLAMRHWYGLKFLVSEAPQILDDH